MEIFKLDKAIENEKLDLEMAMVQLKEAKEHLSQSLKRRKELANQMNDLRYVEERIEDFFPSSNSDEANNAIKELLENNGSLLQHLPSLKDEISGSPTGITSERRGKDKGKPDRNPKHGLVNNGHNAESYCTL